MCIRYAQIPHSIRPNKKLGNWSLECKLGLADDYNDRYQNNNYLIVWDVKLGISTTAQLTDKSFPKVTLSLTATDVDEIQTLGKRKSSSEAAAQRNSKRQPITKPVVVSENQMIRKLLKRWAWVSKIVEDEVIVSRPKR